MPRPPPLPTPTPDDPPGGSTVPLRSVGSGGSSVTASFTATAVVGVIVELISCSHGVDIRQPVRATRDHAHLPRAYPPPRERRPSGPARARPCRGRYDDRGGGGGGGHAVFRALSISGWSHCTIFSYKVLSTSIWTTPARGRRKPSAALPFCVLVNIAVAVEPRYFNAAAELRAVWVRPVGESARRGRTAFSRRRVSRARLVYGGGDAGDNDATTCTRATTDVTNGLTRDRRPEINVH